MPRGDCSNGLRGESELVMSVQELLGHSSHLVRAEDLRHFEGHAANHFIPVQGGTCAVEHYTRGRSVTEYVSEIGSS